MRLKRILNYSSQRRVASVFLCFVLVASLVIGAFLAPIPIYAWSVTGLNTTIASLILSLVLSTGAAPVNDAWLTSLNNAYGVTSTIGTIGDAIDSGLLIESSGALIDNGLAAAIEAESAYTELGLAELFTTTASDAAEYGVIAASGGTNLANTAIEVGTVGTIGAFAGAALAGVGVGVLVNHCIDRFSRWIKAGCPIDFPEPYDIVDGYDYTVVVNYTQFGVKTNSQHFFKNNSYVLGWKNSDYDFGYIVISPGSSVYGRYNSSGEFYNGKFTDKYIWSSNTNNRRDFFYNANIPIYGNYNDTLDHMNSLLNSQEIPNNIKPISPDIITPVGNSYGIVGDDGTDNLAGINGTIPDGYIMSPVDVNDYLNFADNANQNTDNGDTGEENGQLYNDLVNPLYVPDNQQPDQPIVPSNPSQPALPAQPDLPVKPEPSAEEITESLNLATTPTLKEVFPFCIPWDIVDAFTAFKVTNRQAPHIIYVFGNGYVIDVDLSRFDTVAELLRYLELIAFIVGLAMASRALIGAS